MFSKELEDLIQATLEDGVLEDYEKAALVKRATAEGVDLTELEIYINSILQKHKKEHDQAEDAKQEKIDQKKKEAFGRVCPNCGRQVPPMTLKCVCGYEFTQKKQVSSVQILADKIEKISSVGTGDNDDKENEKTKKIINAITMFPVPNSKEDIIEFLSMAVANSAIRGGLWGTIKGRLIIYGALIAIAGLCSLIFTDEGEMRFIIIVFPALYGIYLFFANQDIIRANKIAMAWHDKFEQVMLKARSLRGDQEFTQQLDYFESQFYND